MIKLYKEYVESRRLANIQTKLEIFNELSQVPFLSKRFLLESVLNLSQDDIEHNNKLWHEENGTAEDLIKQKTNNLFKSVGITK